MHTLLSQTAAADAAGNAWPIIASVASLFASGLFGLVLYNLQTLKSSLKSSIEAIAKRQDSQAADIARLIDRKNLCSQDYVGKVEYIRSSNGLEEGMKQLLEKVGTLNGTMRVIEQMPAICGNIAKEIVKEMKQNG